MPSANSKTPRDFLRVAFRHRHVCLLSAALFAIVTLLAAHSLPLKYTGTTKFERRSDAASATRDDEFETIKLTLGHELAGRKAIERIAEELKLLHGLPHGLEGKLTDTGEMQKQDIVEGLQRGTKVAFEVRSRDVDLIAVTVTHSNPEMARRIPDTLVRNYINNVSEKIVRNLTDSRDFLVSQVNAGRSRRTELTNKRIKFESEHAGKMPESPGALAERIQRCIADLDTLRRQQIVAEQKLVIIRASRTSATGPSSRPVRLVVGPNPELKQLRDNLRNQEDSLDTALNVRGMTEKHRAVKMLRAKIKQIKKKISETPEETIIQRIYGNQDGIDTQEAMAKSELDIATREIERLELRKKMLDDLAKDYVAIRQEYVDMGMEISKETKELDLRQKKYTEVQMKLAAEVAKRRTHLSEVLAAQEQTRPSSPKLMFVLGFALVGGLGFGIGLIFVLNFMDRSIGTTEDAIKYFEVPIRGVISEIDSRGKRMGKRLQRWVIRPIIASIVVSVLLTCMLSVVLWLRHPETYKEWKQDRIRFISERVSETAEKVVQTVKNL